MSDIVKMNLRVIVEKAPKGDGDDFSDWCDRQGFELIDDESRAYCEEFGRFLGNFDAVCTTSTGERFLINTANEEALILWPEKEKEGKSIAREAIDDVCSLLEW